MAQPIHDDERPQQGFREQLVVDGLYEIVCTVTTVRLGAVTGQPGWWHFEPLPEGAFVLLRRVSGQQPAPLQAAVTGENGLLYELDPYDNASRTSDVVLYLRAPERYQLWWTLDQELYADALDDLTVLEAEGSILEVRQDYADDRGPLWEELGELEVDASLRHVICHHILHRHVFHESRASPIFDVTPACIRALFMVEFMQWYVVKAHEASGNDLATLQHAVAMIEAAEKGLKDTALERRAAKLFPTPSERRVFDYFRDYAWRCAATGIGRDLFEKSIAVNGPSELPHGGLPPAAALDGGVSELADMQWMKHAEQIRRETDGKKHGPAVHPHLQGITGPIRVLSPDGVELSPKQQELLVDYYESYLFGAALRNTWIDGDEGFLGPSHYRGRMAARMEDWSKQSNAVGAHARSVMEQAAHPVDFLGAVARCYPCDDDLLERLVSAAAYSGLPWWQKLREAEHAAAPRQAPDGSFATEEWPFWKRFKVRLKPLAETAKATGRISRLLGERAAAYQLGLEEARQLLDTVGRLEVTLAGHDVNAKHHIVRTERALVGVVGADEAGEVQISFTGARPPGGPESVTLRLARTAPVAHPGGVPDPPGSPVPANGFRAWSEPRPPFEVVVPAHLEGMRAIGRLSKAFAVLAETLNLAIATVTVCDQAKAKDKALAFFDLTKSLVGVVESLPSALIAMSPPLEKHTLLRGIERSAQNLRGTSTWLSRVDGVLKIYKGLEMLVSDESDLQYELRQGRSFRADLQRYNGFANIVAGISSAAELAGVAAAASGGTELLGCSAALLAGFSATPWGLFLTLGGSILVAGSALVLDLTQPWTDKITALERALDAACRQEVRNARFKASTRLDALTKVIG